MRKQICWHTQKMLKLARARCLQLCELGWKKSLWKKFAVENLVLALRRPFLKVMAEDPTTNTKVKVSCPDKFEK